MEHGPVTANASVFVPSNWWDEMQTELQDAVSMCMDITTKIANHQYNGEYKAEELIDCIDSRVRTIRKAIERRIVPF